MSGRGFIAEEEDGECAYCHKVAELRPYGKNGEEICFDCGMLNEETSKKQMCKLIYGEGLDS